MQFAAAGVEYVSHAYWWHKKHSKIALLTYPRVEAGPAKVLDGVYAAESSSLQVLDGLGEVRPQSGGEESKERLGSCQPQEQPLLFPAYTCRNQYNLALCTAASQD